MQVNSHLRSCAEPRRHWTNLSYASLYKGVNFQISKSQCQILTWDSVESNIEDMRINLWKPFANLFNQIFWVCAANIWKTHVWVLAHNSKPLLAVEYRVKMRVGSIIFFLFFNLTARVEVKQITCKWIIIVSWINSKGN